MLRTTLFAFLIAALATALMAQDHKDPAPTPGANAPALQTGSQAGAKTAEAKTVEAKATPAAAAPASIEFKTVPDADNTCIQCHTSPEPWDPKDKAQYKFHIPLDALKNDIHWQKGIRCQDCHGGDTTILEVKAHQAKGDFRAIRTPADIPEFCGRCHSNAEYMRHFVPSPRIDELSEYWTSRHGKALKAGDTNVATCISCHDMPHGNAIDTTPRGIRAVKDPASPVYHTKVPQTCAKCHADKDLMQRKVAGKYAYEYDGKPLPCDEYEKWRGSVHGKALMDTGDMSAPACNNCHGNHGAAPPQIDSVVNACGSCHGKIAKLFSDTKMRHKFEKEGLPGCATCHSNHAIRQPSDEFLGMQSGTFCSRCHEQGKLQHGATLAGTEAAKKLHDGIERLKTGIATADDTLAKAEDLGMEVSKPKFDLRKASDDLTNARTLIHSFNVATVDKALADGDKVVTEVQAEADAALREHTQRRIWLAASLVPILIVIGLLLLYIRNMPADDGKK
jgi:predicted CXXCH cytochrome family protein